MLPLAVNTVLDGRGVTSVGDLMTSTAMQVGDVWMSGTVGRDGGLSKNETLSKPPRWFTGKGLMIPWYSCLYKIYKALLNLYFLENRLSAGAGVVII